MFLFSPKKAQPELDDPSEGSQSSGEKGSYEHTQPAGRKSIESKSFLSYLGFGGKKKLEEPEDEIEEGNVSDDVEEDGDVKKVFYHPTQLPINFAEEVLDLEMKIDSSTDFTQKDIDRLVYLYSQAMEFYEESNRDKYQSFKDRIQKLLVNPMVFNRMKNQEVKTRDRCLTDNTSHIRRPNDLIKINKNAPKCNQGPAKPTSGQVKIKNTKRVKELQLDMSMRVLETVEQTEEEKSKIINKYNNFEKRKSTIVHDDISIQQMSLHKRLAQRKFKRSNSKTQGAFMNSTKHAEQQASMDSNDSGGFSKTLHFDDLGGLNEMDISVQLGRPSRK